MASPEVTIWWLLSAKEHQSFMESSQKWSGTAPPNSFRDTQICPNFKMRPRDHKENKQTTNHLHEHTDIKILEIYFYYFTSCVYRFVRVSIECPWSTEAPWSLSYSCRELLDVDAGARIWVLCSSRACFQRLSHLYKFLTKYSKTNCSSI